MGSAQAVGEQPKSGADDQHTPAGRAPDSWTSAVGVHLVLHIGDEPAEHCEHQRPRARELNHRGVVVAILHEEKRDAADDEQGRDKHEH